MSDKNAEIVREAVARNVTAVLSLPSAGMLRNHKSRFISDLEGGILLQAPPDDGDLIAEILRNQTACLVSFRSGINRVSFASTIRRLEPHWRLNEQTIIAAILLEFPQKITAKQKRTDYRVSIPAHTDISIQVWRLAEREILKDKPPRGREVKANIFDLSVGGAGVKLIGTDGHKPKICPEDRLRVALTFNRETIILEGKMRPPSMLPEGETIIAGIKFKALQDDHEGRRIHTQLQKIVGEMQRAELRMMKLGIKATA